MLPSCLHSLPPLAQPAAGHIVSSDQLSAYLSSAFSSGSHTVVLFLQEKVCLLVFYHMPNQRNWKWKIETSAYRVKFVLKFHGFHNVPQKTMSVDTWEVFSRVIVSHVHGCCQLHMTQSFHAGVTMRAPVSLLLSQYQIFLGLILIALLLLYADVPFCFLTTRLIIIYFCVQLSKDDFTVFGGVYGNKEDSAFQNLEVGYL